MTYNRRDIQKILKNNGWSIHHQTGSHMIYRNERNQHLTVNTNCNKMVFRRLIKEYNLKVN